MKIVLNRDCGGSGYKVPEELLSLIKKFENDRIDREPIAFVKNHRGNCGILESLEIPDNIIFLNATR